MTTREWIEAIERAKATFGPMIDYIRFPFFRNLVPDSRIDFKFPITAFVGPNGCGKSTTLQAMFGAPEGRSLETYWFSTPIDEIKQPDNSTRHCFIYAHSNKGAVEEVLKTRIFKSGESDTWETSEGIKNYAMPNVGSRGEQLKKNVVYFNFKTVQNAFDKKFNEERPPQSGVQPFLRGKSKHLKWALDNPKKMHPRYGSKTHEPPLKLSSECLAQAGKILGRTYQGAQLIKHRFFDMWGSSLLLTRDGNTYSEAWAGSGESSIFMLVHELLAAPQNSLLLLDEPETSLHPGAQEKLQHFLLELALRQKHQMVICTHAPSIIEGFPDAAIVAFQQTAEGRFRVIPDVPEREAFVHLGQRPANKIRILVEDNLAKALVETVLQDLPSEAAKTIEVGFQPGGASALWKDIPHLNRAGDQNTWILFDGDERRQGNLSEDLTHAETQNPFDGKRVLDARIKSVCNSEIPFPSDNNPSQVILQQRTFLKRVKDRVRFLPESTPEQLVWDEGAAIGLAEVSGQADLLREELRSLECHKTKFAALTQIISTSADSPAISAIEGFFVKRWAHKRDASWQQLRAILEEIRISNVV